MKWEGYKVWVPKKKKYKLLLNSDEKRFGGNGEEVPAGISAVKDADSHKNLSITVDLPPYTALIFSF